MKRNAFVHALEVTRLGPYAQRGPAHDFRPKPFDDHQRDDEKKFLMSLFDRGTAEIWLRKIARGLTTQELEFMRSKMNQHPDQARSDCE